MDRLAVSVALGLAGAAAAPQTAAKSQVLSAVHDNIEWLANVRKFGY